MCLRHRRITHKAGEEGMQVSLADTHMTSLPPGINESLYTLILIHLNLQ